MTDKNNAGTKAGLVLTAIQQDCIDTLVKQLFGLCSEYKGKLPEQNSLVSMVFPFASAFFDFKTARRVEFLKFAGTNEISTVLGLIYRARQGDDFAHLIIQVFIRPNPDRDCFIEAGTIVLTTSKREVDGAQVYVLQQSCFVAVTSDDAGRELSETVAILGPLNETFCRVRDALNEILSRSK